MSQRLERYAKPPLTAPPQTANPRSFCSQSADSTSHQSEEFRANSATLDCINIGGNAAKGHEVLGQDCRNGGADLLRTFGCANLPHFCLEDILPNSVRFRVGMAA